MRNKCTSKPPLMQKQIPDAGTILVLVVNALDSVPHPSKVSEESVCCFHAVSRPGMLCCELRPTHLYLYVQCNSSIRAALPCDYEIKNK